MDVAGFRASPVGVAFADATAYPDASVSFYLTLATNALDPNRWCDYLDLGTSLFVAHFLALDALAAKAGGTGIPGLSLGIANSKSLGDASIAYDTASILDKSAGQWNLTAYGVRFWSLIRIIGAGGVQL